MKSTLLLIVLAVAVQARAQPPAGERTYAGRPAGDWIGRLSDADGRTRWLAAYALGRIAPQSPRAVAALAKAVDDEDLNVCRYAIHALGRIGPPARAAAPALVRVLRDETDPFYRRAAARALGSIAASDNDSTAALTAALADRDAVLRVEAALALWQLGRRDAAVDALKAALDAAHPQARYRATTALAEMGDDSKLAGGQLLRALVDEDADLRRGAARVMGRIGLPAAGPLVRMLEDPATSGASRRSVAAALGSIGRLTVEEVIYNPQSPPQAAAEAAGALRRTIVPPLAGLLSHRDEELRRAAAVALGRCGLPAVSVLVENLAGRDEQRRAAAALALEQFERHFGRQPVARHVVDPVKQAILPGLVEVIGRGNGSARYRAIRLFTLLDCDATAAGATDALEASLRDADSRVRQHAARALRQIRRGQ